ncbi:MAG TPA: aminodeoxychorismate synthase component I [Pyrinomonadaceae bacterium]|jgi:para-aminobenzoate synthetase component 1
MFLIKDLISSSLIYPFLNPCLSVIISNGLFCGLLNFKPGSKIDIFAEMHEIAINAEELILRCLAQPSENLAILDSCGSRLGNSRYLIAGINPIESFEFFCRTKSDAEAALYFLDEKLESRINHSSFFLDSGACAATFAYEFGMLFENLEPQRKEFQVIEQPSATFDFYETLIVHDYQTGKTFAVGKQSAQIAHLLEKARAEPAFNRPKSISVKCNFSKSDYLQAINQIRKHIAAGNIYQANLTQQFLLESEEKISPESVFLHLRKSHPAPFAAFIRRKNDCIVSASPERFLKVQSPKSEAQSHRIVTTSPIKGTRRRGKTPEEDLLLRRELQQSRKDRAENVMIVDLLRNDLGRVCEFGSVKVEKLCEIEEYPTLFHSVSTVSGRLRENAKASDLIKAAFPCGSITGAPKVRAMQILDQIETAQRGISMGAIGYFGFDGSIDLNVAIRTAAVRENQAVLNVGGGIVFDSEPEAEYEESLIKTKALFDSFGVSDFRFTT